MNSAAMTPTDVLTTVTQPGPTGDLPIALPVGRAVLGPMFAAAGFTRGAEIGVWEGKFAETLCRPNPGLSLTCVDPWQTMPDYKEGKNTQARMADAFRSARRRLMPFSCEFLKMTSVDAADRVKDGSLDFVYIDGNHLFEHVLQDLKRWVPKVRTGGIVAGHDYGVRDKDKTFIQVKPAVDQFTREHAIAPWFVLSADRSASYLWVVR